MRVGSIVSILAISACTPAPASDTPTTVTAHAHATSAGPSSPPSDVGAVVAAKPTLEVVSVDPPRPPTTASTASATVTTPAEAPTVDVSAAARESLGGVSLGTALSELAKTIPGGKSELPPLEDAGTPRLFGGRDLPPADERWLWSYDTPGLATVLAGRTDEGPWRVVHLTAHGRSKHRTNAGIGVRSTIAQVRKAYPAAVFDGEDSATVALADAQELEILFDGGRATHVSLAPAARD